MGDLVSPLSIRTLVEPRTGFARTLGRLADAPVPLSAAGSAASAAAAQLQRPYEAWLRGRDDQYPVGI